MRLAGESSPTRDVPRFRILIWATVIAILFGVVGFGEPVDSVLRSVRDAIARHPTSGRIVIVAIDDRTLEHTDRWPWPRHDFAQISDALVRAGAEQIMFDINFASPSERNEDLSLRDAFRRAGGRVSLAARFTVDPVTGARSEVMPLPLFRPHVRAASINLRYDILGAVSRVPYAVRFSSGLTPSASAWLAGKGGDPDKLFPIDYSFNLKSVPVISALDVMNGTVDLRSLRGRRVIVGTTSDILRDSFYVMGRGPVPGVFFHALGAETLLAGRPVDIGWVGLALLGFIIAAGGLLWCGPRPRYWVFGLGVLVLLVVPFFLERFLIFGQIVPGLALIMFAVVRSTWASFRHSYRRQGSINKISGMPNLHALRLLPPADEHVLVAARINNFAEITAALAVEKEKALVEQIADRLTLGAQGLRLFQGDEGIFAWFIAPGEDSSLGDHLDALHALFRSPVILQTDRFDLAVTFGVDASGGRSNTNRLGSALVAADEAAGEGLRWKRYDPAKLKDASWKLSLLSQLDSAIDNGDLWIAYQPKIDASTRRVVSAEALARWTHPEKGPISPVDFIPIAEQSNRIEKLTLHVLERAIAAAAGLAKQPGAESFGIAVNLSPRALGMPGLVDTVGDLLDRYGLPPAQLTLEVTENAAIGQGTTLETFEALCALGVQLSIDDYGTGLSTLDYLKRIPASEIKIDKSFVQTVDRSHGDRLMVHSTIQLAHSLGRRVVAEGVERTETYDTLVRLGCDIIQGYLVGRPMPLPELSEMLDRQTAGVIAA